MLLSFGCSTEKARTTFAGQSIQFSSEALRFYNSSKPTELNTGGMFVYYKSAEKSSLFLTGSKAVMDQMYIVYGAVHDYRFAYARKSEHSKECREVLSQEIEKLANKIDNFSRKK